MCLDFDLITAMPVSPKVAAVLGYFQNCSLFSSPDNICRGTICLLSQVRMPCSRLGSLLVLIASTACWCSAQQTYADRPPYTSYAKMARWLVHKCSWGTVATLHKGTPFANVVSFSDGPLDNSTGRLLFYLTTLDETAQDLEDSAWASLSVAEASLRGSCGKTDPEDPTCAKLSVSGKLEPVKEDALQEAEALLFSRHEAMRSWPTGHHFAVYELHIKELRLLDWYGGAHLIPLQEYFAAQPDVPIPGPH